MTVLRVLRTVVLTPSGRGARLDEDALSACEVVREVLLVPSLRGEEVSREPTLGRVVPVGTRVGRVDF